VGDGGSRGEIAIQDHLRKACEEVAGIAFRNHIQEEVGSGLQFEAAVGETSHPPTKEGLEPFLEPPTSHGKENPAGKQPFHSPHPTILPGQDFSHLPKHLPGIGPSMDEAKEIRYLLIGDPSALPNLLTVSPNLELHSLAEPQTPRHGLGRILVPQHFRGKIPGPDDLQGG
jgi:hypothetical protein